MKPFIDSKQLVMLGVIQEQHADRCLLFQQWQKLDFPVVQDPFNANGIKEVPVYVAIDEYGVVRGLPRQPVGFAADFIEQDFAEPESPADIVDSHSVSTEYWQAKIERSDAPEPVVGLADSLLLWDRDPAKVRRAVELYTQATQRQPDRSDVKFRLGVAYRMLYEFTDRREAHFFTQAVANWESALLQKPNQYIYRRRIEQYGPRLKKPYSFYDWVNVARQEILDRGETPRELLVEPNGAEFAHRAEQMTVDNSAENPDPRNRIIRDQDFVQTHVNFVPSEPSPGDVVAVHVGFTVSGTAKWNHETSPLVMWVHPPDGNVRISSPLIRDQAQYSEAESQTPLSLSFEMQIPEDQEKSVQLDAFALFNICESDGGAMSFSPTRFHNHSAILCEVIAERGTCHSHAPFTAPSFIPVRCCHLRGPVHHQRHA